MVHLATMVEAHKEITIMVMEARVVEDLSEDVEEAEDVDVAEGTSDVGTTAEAGEMKMARKMVRMTREIVETKAMLRRAIRPINRKCFISSL